MRLRVLCLLLLRKSCGTSTSQRLETGRPSSGQREQRQGFRPKRIGNKQKGEPRQFAEKSLPCAVAPRREAGKAGGRQRKEAAAGGAVRQQARRRRLLGSMGIVAQGGEKKRRP